MTAKKPWPPDLAKPIPRTFAILRGAIVQEIEALREQRLRQLLEYHEIDPQDPLALRKLIYSLVPGLQIEGLGKRGRGRPRKAGVQISRQPRKRGRPGFWGREWYEIILDAREMGEKLLRDKGKRGKVTDIAALEAYFKDLTGTNPLRGARETAAQWTKRLPDARKFVRNLPRK